MSSYVNPYAWQDWEELILRRCLRRGYTKRQIGESLGRSLNAINDKMRQKGLKSNPAKHRIPKRKTTLSPLRVWARERYNQQRKWSAVRGIAFELTFEEWLTWWEQELGPDWNRLRGTGPFQFCMGRKGDVGPYKLGNIHCITNLENAMERHHITKEEILTIYQDPRHVDEIAKDYNRSDSTIRAIKNRRTWMEFKCTVQRVPQHRKKGFEREYRRKLSDDEIIEIYFARGYTKEIGKRYGVTASQVSVIKNKQGWGHLLGSLPPAPKNKRGRPRKGSMALGSVEAR